MGLSAFSAYGLVVQPTFDLPVGNAGSPGEADVTLRIGDRDELSSRWSGPRGGPAWQTMFPGGSHVCLQVGVDGDHLLSYGPHAVFHLSRDAGDLLCVPADQDAPGWRRFLLDTGLHCVSLVRGYEALHASAVSMPEGLIALVAASGAGKTSIAAELVRRGHTLFCDDVLALSRSNGHVLGHASPPLMNLPLDGPTPGEEVGQVLEEFGEEGSAWVHVKDAGGRPGPLVGIFLLERCEGSRPSLTPDSAGPLRLLPHTLSLGADPGRALSRYGLIRDLVANAPVFRLQADPGHEIGEIADLVSESLGDPLHAAEDVA